MVLVGYCYFALLGLVATFDLVVPIRLQQMVITFGIFVKCLPGATLCGYAWNSTVGGISLLWLLLLVYHIGSLAFSMMAVAILNRSRYKEKRIESEQESAQPESRKTAMLRRVYGTAVYVVQLALWYYSFGT